MYLTRQKSTPLMNFVNLLTVIHKIVGLADVIKNCLALTAFKTSANTVWTLSYSKMFKMTYCRIACIYIQNSISISSSSARTFVSTGWRIKIYAFVLTHSRTLTARPHGALWFSKFEPYRYDVGGAMHEASCKLWQWQNDFVNQEESTMWRVSTFSKSCAHDMICPPLQVAFASATGGGDIIN